MNNTPHQVIPQPTRQRVLVAAAELGYTPSAAARMLVSGRSDVVLLLLPDWPIGLGVARLLDELSQAFAQHDLTFVIHPQVTARPVTELWKSITPAAVLAYESFGETDLMAISRSGAELVVISDLNHGAGAMDRSVERTGRIQVEHLAGSGHRHLGYAWPDNDRVLYFAQHRLDAVRAACARPDGSSAHLKVIMETGELQTYDNVRRASWLSMLAGGHFIKTSTGKVQPAATLPVTMIMLEAVRDFREATGQMVGVKPAGGIRTTKDAIKYLVTVNEVAGPDWLDPDWFRFGASTLLNDLLMQRSKLATGHYSGPDYVTLD